MNDFFQELEGPLLKLLEFPLFRSGQTQITVSSICAVLILFGVVLLMEYVFRKHMFPRLMRRSHMEPSIQYTIGKIAGYVVLTLGFYISLLVVGIDLSSLALIAGAIGVGLGFGLQNIISNFVSGIIILFERSLKVGDYVQLASGVSGEVQEINMRSTLITTNDNIDIIVPNSEFVNGQVINWTLNEATRRIHVPFGVAYGTNKEMVRKAVLEAADLVSYTVRGNEKRKPQVWFVGFGASSLDFELVVWVGPDSVSRPGTVQAAYLWEIHTALYKYQIEIPFPQNDLHLRSVLGLKDAQAKEWLEQHFSRKPPAAPPDAPGS